MEKSRRPLSLTHKRKPLTTQEKQLYIIETLPGIGPTLAKSLLKEFKTIKNVINAEEKDFQKIDKIGKIKAKELKELFEEVFQQ